MITVDPPVVHPSLGEIALITGMADVGYNPGQSAGIKYLKIAWSFQSGPSETDTFTYLHLSWHLIYF